MNQRPVVSVTLYSAGEKLDLDMLLDTGADLTIVHRDHWPSCWPLVHAVKGVEGVGGLASVQKSQDRICVIIDGWTASTHITVMSLPQGVDGLLGRDVLDQLGVVLTTDKPFH